MLKAMYINQSIHRPQGVNVFGSCLIRVDPDYASVRFSVWNVCPEPRDALDQTHAGSERARQALAKHQVAPRDIRSSRVSLVQWYQGQGEARVPVGYRAQIGFQVLVRDLARVEALLLDVVAAGAREIDGVSYKTSRLKTIRAEARAGAVSAARSKAEVYAGAAGRHVGQALHIEDVNPDDFVRRSHMPDIEVLDPDESERGDAAGSIVIAGAVMACFALVD
jgi:uncharacterized protein YggE